MVDMKQLTNLFDISFLKSQPKYVLYGSGLIFLGLVFIILGLIFL